MSKKSILRGLLVVAMMLALQMTAFASEEEMTGKQIDAVQSFVSENAARIVGSPRGMLISSVELSITDLGRGKVELYGKVLCHEPMEKIRLNLILDKWDSGDEAWSQVEKFEFTWLAEDYPGEELTLAFASAEVSDLERGIEYRIRGTAGAWDLDSSLYEVFNAGTKSILVE